MLEVATGLAKKFSWKSVAFSIFNAAVNDATQGVFGSTSRSWEADLEDSVTREVADDMLDSEVYHEQCSPGGMSTTDVTIDRAMLGLFCFIRSAFQ